MTDTYPSLLRGLTTKQVRRLAAVDPKLYADLTRRLEFQQMKLDREMYEDSLIAFFERAWREIDPAPYEHGWHLTAGAQQLDRLGHDAVHLHRPQGLLAALRRDESCNP